MNAEIPLKISPNIATNTIPSAFGDTGANKRDRDSYITITDITTTNTEVITAPSKENLL